MSKFTENIFAHRGYWKSKNSENSIESFSQAANRGFSIETDLRSFGNKIIVSHDSLGSELKHDIEIVFKFKSRFALNIKSDGLIEQLPGGPEWYLDTKSFFFDGSIPELYKYKKKGFPIALRLSEFEKDLPWYSKIIWLDSFESDWWIGKSIVDRLTEKHFVVIVSPELHNREHLKVWDYVSNLMATGNMNVGICTDYPEKFSENLES
jgi:glycerophosphoryl diester phosphodiesterase